MKKKLQYIYHNVSTKQVVIYFVVFFLFTVLVLPYISSLTTRVIGVAESPDTNFDFNIERLFNIVNSYGRSGRLFYVTMRWTFDVVWPIIYTLFLITSIAYLSRQSKCRFGYKPLYLPVIAVLFDFMENVNATIIMLLYPKRFDLFGYLLIGSSIIKWISISISIVALILLLILFIIKSIKKDVVL
jgi:hypothetical protein